MTAPPLDLVVLYEHPEWQKPLFAALERRGLRFHAYDLKRAAFGEGDVPPSKLVFNQASPSAYVRGNTRAVPLALALMTSLELSGRRVLNGSKAFSLELSKTAQAALLRRLGIATPRIVTFNDVGALRDHVARHGFPFPALVKPEQGGSGARMTLVESVDEVERLLRLAPATWEPDNLLLLQEYVPYDRARGIVRLELLGGELLYGMRVVTHGGFNLCPSETCNPVDGSDGACALPDAGASAAPKARPPEFFPYPDVPRAAVEQAQRIAREAGLDVCGIEYLEADDGRLVFYDVNANSNLRPAVAQAFGFDPFERVVDFLEARLRSA